MLYITVANIENANAYDKKMVRMNELGFSRKLSNEELKTSQVPLEEFRH